ncbi:FGGY-family carbohydrate kinase [Lusitaniella coriacea LEGE 07157]|uniref:D-ribulose kinase n=1 Tax=Lusitaniella coriacea LEGE 07157 TaxID=945747 RepID=A0A8J7DY02_9CYAN|nr:FGGY-family carbohydrate kinase [Lusitaniella coriacea]MBE9117486.1 FGGY-family carbohydrate kinase [Lusitaniella coriacea LEGE 07157]
MTYYLGIDFGTSGARGVVIDGEEKICWEFQYPFAASGDWVAVWRKALFSILEQIPLEIKEEMRAIALNGTSSTVLLCDRAGNPLDAPILYNDDRAINELETLKKIAPSHPIVLSATSSLAKLFWWYRQPIYSQAVYFLHQADWLAFLLHGQLGISDYHNALKLGYDVEELNYPAWLQKLPISPLLPQVFSPGTPVGTVTPEISFRFGLSKKCCVCTGTTDSIAAFLASGATQPGEAVTSLGSTLVLKLLSSTKIDNAKYGIYSHRLGNLWLVGGASNTGGAVLRHFFSDAELARLSQQIDPQIESPLDYYPLLKKGERFPLNDPELEPRIEPQPDNPVEFLHGLLESLARIETQGYQLLQQFGATPLYRVYTAGGGAKNEIWTALRQRYLNVPVLASSYTEAAYGTALLAARSHDELEKRGRK